jgi:hypothetical protein
MQALVLNPTEDTPKIVLDPGSSVFEISGRSLPEDVTVFYQPVLDWLDGYASSPTTKLALDIKLEYFNTASSKLLLDILMKMENIKTSGADVSVKWYYDSNDEDMHEAGEEYSELVSLPFELVGM